MDSACIYSFCSLFLRVFKLDFVNGLLLLLLLYFYFFIYLFFFFHILQIMHMALLRSNF